MKGIMGILFCFAFFVIGEISAQKTRKYTIKNDIQHGVFDSLLKQSFKNKVLIASNCDTTLLKEQMSIFLRDSKKHEEAPLEMLCDLGNLYHAWMMITLCRNQSLIRAGNDTQFGMHDTLLIDGMSYTLHSLRESIIRLGLKSQLHLTFALWDGTITGANPPKKSWTKKSLKSMIHASAKSYFKNANDEFTPDLSVNTLCISEKVLRELYLLPTENEIDIGKVLHVLNPYLPEYVAAYCALNKGNLRIRTLPASDILARKQ
jgi:hypothetical protein